MWTSFNVLLNIQNFSHMAHYTHTHTPELLYADDLAVIAETEEELIKRLNEWKENVESKGMRVNMNKTKVR